MEKLVRDKIIDLIEDKSLIRIETNEEERKRLVLNKIIEEASEFAENPCLEEYADLVTILNKAFELFEFKEEDFIKTMIDKNRRRGEFNNFYVLEIKKD